MEEKKIKKEADDIIEENPPAKRSRLPYLIGVILLIIIAVALFLLLRPRGKGVSAQMRQMQETVGEIQDLESEIQERQNQILNLVSDYKKQTGQDIGQLNLLNLTPSQKQLLEERIKSEKDVSIRSMLQEIIDQKTEIGGLQERLQELEALLPKPHQVEKGENHFRIAMDFLVNQRGLEKGKALKMVEKIALFEPLIPGFKVWNFYANNEYGSFVTQGSALVSPNAIQHRARQKLIDARDQAIAEKEKLQGEITQYQAIRNELVTQIDALNQEKETMLVKIGDLDRQNQALQQELNSVYYILDLKKSLKSRGILKSRFLGSPKLMSVDPELYNLGIDLRDKTSISISAAELNVGKIKKVKLYPSFFKEENDYSVVYAEDSQSAVLTFINGKKFRNERVVISVN